MATRPVFVPDTDPTCGQLVHEHEVDFQWMPEGQPDPRNANILRLHRAAGLRKLEPLLEVSAGSADPLGVRVGPEQLTVRNEDSYFISLDRVYHGSKVFTGGGPFTDLYRRHEGDVRKDPRLDTSGSLAGFRFQGLEWGRKSGTMFYDWLVVQAIHRQRKLGAELGKYAGFTDVGCHSGGNEVCHARSCALYVALAGKKLVDEVLTDQDRFIETLILDSFYGR